MLKLLIHNLNCSDSSLGKPNLGGLCLPNLAIGYQLVPRMRTPLLVIMGHNRGKLQYCHNTFFVQLISMNIWSVHVYADPVRLH